MKDIIEENLKIISEYAKEPQNRLDSTPTPQTVQDAIIKVEQALYEATRNDSASLKTIINEFGVRLLVGRNFYGMIAHVAARDNRDSLELLIDTFGESN